MREPINTDEALRLYHILRNWREVAAKLTRIKCSVPFTTGAVIAAVRRQDRREA